MKRFLIVMICIGILAAVANAQDQVITINDTPGPLPAAAVPLIKAGAQIERTSAKQLIERTLATKEALGNLDDPNFYCIIHILEWKDGERAVKSQNWYVYQGGAWSDAQFKGTRIYGKKKIALLYVHMNARTTAAYQGITYRVEVSKKLPFPVQSLLSLFNLIQAQADEPINLWGGSLMLIEHNPSDVTVRAFVPSIKTSELQEVGKQTYDNEGRYYWDVSVGLPVSKIKELEFNAQDGTVRPKEIDKQKLFAFFNFYLKPIDTKGTHVEPWPHPIVGLALSKKPLDRIFVGGGWGLNKIDFFAGVAFNKTQTPSTLAPGAAASQSQLEADLKTTYQPKFVMGLNIPVRQILDKLKAK